MGDQVLAATNETMTVLKEITSVMQVIAEVTIEEHEDEQEDKLEEEEEEEDLNGLFKEEGEEDGFDVLEDGMVGEALAGEPEADQWTGLVKRLSISRSQKRRKKSKV